MSCVFRNFPAMALLLTFSQEQHLSEVWSEVYSSLNISLKVSRVPGRGWEWPDRFCHFFSYSQICLPSQTHTAQQYEWTMTLHVTCSKGHHIRVSVLSNVGQLMVKKWVVLQQQGHIKSFQKIHRVPYDFLSWALSLIQITCKYIYVELTYCRKFCLWLCF